MTRLEREGNGAGLDDRAVQPVAQDDLTLAEIFPKVALATDPRGSDCLSRGCEKVGSALQGLTVGRAPLKHRVLNAGERTFGTNVHPGLTSGCELLRHIISTVSSRTFSWEAA